MDDVAIPMISVVYVCVCVRVVTLVLIGTYCCIGRLIEPLYALDPCLPTPISNFGIGRVVRKYRF